MDKSRIEELRSRYAGRISADVRDEAAIDMGMLAGRLMREWNPVHSSVSDLKALMGTATREESGVLEYVFDNGLDGDVWRFSILDDVVASVEWEPLD